MYEYIAVRIQYKFTVNIAILVYINTVYCNKNTVYCTSKYEYTVYCYEGSYI